MGVVGVWEAGAARKVPTPGRSGAPSNMIGPLPGLITCLITLHLHTDPPPAPQPPPQPYSLLPSHYPSLLLTDGLAPTRKSDAGGITATSRTTCGTSGDVSRTSCGAQGWWHQTRPPRHLSHQHILLQDAHLTCTSCLFNGVNPPRGGLWLRRKNVPPR